MSTVHNNLPNRFVMVVPAMVDTMIRFRDLQEDNLSSADDYLQGIGTISLGGLISTFRDNLVGIHFTIYKDLRVVRFVVGRWSSLVSGSVGEVVSSCHSVTWQFEKHNY